MGGCLPLPADLEGGTEGAAAERRAELSRRVAASCLSWPWSGGARRRGAGLSVVGVDACPEVHALLATASRRRIGAGGTMGSEGGGYGVACLTGRRPWQWSELQVELGCLPLNARGQAAAGRARGDRSALMASCGTRMVTGSGGHENVVVVAATVTRG